MLQKGEKSFKCISIRYLWLYAFVFFFLRDNVLSQFFHYFVKTYIFTCVVSRTCGVIFQNNVKEFIGSTCSVITSVFIDDILFKL